MTVQVSAATQRIRELNKVCELAGQKIAASIVSPDGKLLLEDGGREKAIVVLETSLAISRNAQAWWNGERTYESWLKMFREQNTNFDVFFDLDETGELRKASLELLSFEDMREYYEVDIVALDLSQAQLAIDAQEWVISMLKNGQL